MSLQSVITLLLIVVVLYLYIFTRWRFRIKKKIITRNDTMPYLIRYTIFNCPLFGIKLHNLLRSDDDCLHDHPWAFISFILKGGYVEHRVDKIIAYEEAKDISALDDFFFDPSNDTFQLRSKRLYGSPRILFRPSNWIHKLEVYQPTWTLVITFKKVKKWGFFTPRGWIEWFKYNGCECN